MEIPPEVVAAKEALSEPLLQADLITGIDFGFRDEDAADPEDLALRVFVADETAVPFEVQAALAAFPFPVVVIQRVFRATSLPDASRRRPVQGGTSIGAARFSSSGAQPVGTLGHVVQDAANPDIFYGLSNFHVMCVDPQRQVGDEIHQPEPDFFVGPQPVDRIGTLDRWVFPENTPSGRVDAALCRLETDGIPEVVEIGPVFGMLEAKRGMLVSKRGRSTGLTFGVVTGLDGDYNHDYPAFPAVGFPPSTRRTFTKQIQIRVDFPQFIVFGDEGDSGALVVGPDNRAVGLYWGSGSTAPGDPLVYGVASPIDVVASQLRIRI